MSTPDRDWWEAEATALSAGHVWMVQAIAAALAAAYQQGREETEAIAQREIERAHKMAQKASKDRDEWKALYEANHG